MTATAITSLSRVRGREPSQARGGEGVRLLEADTGSSGKDGTTSPPGGPGSLQRRTATTTPTTITTYTTSTTEGVDWNPWNHSADATARNCIGASTSGVQRRIPRDPISCAITATIAGTAKVTKR
jgi:hypothetical protein